MSEQDPVTANLVNMAASQINAGIIILGARYTILFWNHFMEIHSGIPANEAQGKELFELYPKLASSGIKKKLQSVFLLKNLAFTSWEYRPYLFKFPNPRSVIGGEEYMFQDCTFFPMVKPSREVEHICISVFDATNSAVYQQKLKRITRSLQQQRNELAELNRKLEEAQNQLLQSEKMAAIGQRAWPMRSTTPLGMSIQTSHHWTAISMISWMCSPPMRHVNTCPHH